MPRIATYGLTDPSEPVQSAGQILALVRGVFYPSSDMVPSWLTAIIERNVRYESPLTMWRLCDLHNHTFPNESCTDAWDAEAFVRSCVDVGLDVVAITDHDSLDRYDEIVDAAGESLVIIPGVELSS